MSIKRFFLIVRFRKHFICLKYLVLDIVRLIMYRKPSNGKEGPTSESLWPSGTRRGLTCVRDNAGSDTGLG